MSTFIVSSMSHKTISSYYFADTDENDISSGRRSWCIRWWRACGRKVRQGMRIAELRAQIIDWRTQLRQPGSRLVIGRGMYEHTYHTPHNSQLIIIPDTQDKHLYLGDSPKGRCIWWTHESKVSCTPTASTDARTRTAASFTGVVPGEQLIELLHSS